MSRLPTVRTLKLYRDFALVQHDRIASRHPSPHFDAVDKRDADRIAAGASGTPKMAFDLVEIKVGKLRVGS